VERDTQEHEGFERSEFEVVGFHAYENYLPNSVIICDVSDRLLEHYDALKGMKVSEGHASQTFLSKNDCSSNIVIDRHFVECGTYDGALNCFTLVKIKAFCSYCIYDASDVISIVSGRAIVYFYMALEDGAGEGPSIVSQYFELIG
jgi:hypothetical protein